MVVVARPTSKDNSGMDESHSATPLRIEIVKPIHNKPNESLWLACSMDYYDYGVAPDRLPRAKGAMYGTRTEPNIVCFSLQGSCDVVAHY
jgi:hypothetical protein